MRICYLINGLNGGGAALPLPDVVSLMQREGHQVSVLALCRQDGRSEQRLREAGLSVRVLGPERIGLRSFVRLLRVVRAERPDVIWTSLAKSMLLGQLAGWWLRIPVVSWQHNAYLEAHKKRALRLTRSSTALWAVDSDAVRQFAIAEMHLPPARVCVWPLFIATDSPTASTWTEEGRFRVGSLGRLHHNKGYDVLIRAMARMTQLDAGLASRLDIVIAGSGPLLADLQALAGQLGVVNVRFEGFIARPAEFLASLHGYVQPSRTEGLCLAAHEAMQAGLPVIASPVGQLARSIVDGRSGWHSRTGDVECLAFALLDMVRDPAHAARIGAAARVRVLSLFARERFEAAGRAILHRVEEEVVGRS